MRRVLQGVTDASRNDASLNFGGPASRALLFVDMNLRRRRLRAVRTAAQVRARPRRARRASASAAGRGASRSFCLRGCGGAARGDAVGGSRQRGVPAACRSGPARRLPLRARRGAHPRRGQHGHARPSSCASRWRGASRSRKRRRARTSMLSSATWSASGGSPASASPLRSTSGTIRSRPAREVRSLMFVERFAADVDRRLAAFEG